MTRASRWKRWIASASALASSGRNLIATLPAKPRVFGFVDDAHAAGAEARQDLVVGNRFADHSESGLRFLEHFANLLGQLHGRKRLLQKRLAFVQHAGLHDSLVRVARHVKHTNGGPKRAQRFGHGGTAHVTKNDIAERQIEMSRVVAAEGEAGASRRCLGDGIAEPVEQLLRQTADRRVVFDKQDVLVARRHSVGGGLFDDLLRLRRHAAGRCGTSCRDQSRSTPKCGLRSAGRCRMR